MKIPKFLSVGDTIGITSPSYYAFKEDDGIRFENASKKLSEKGYKVRLTDSVYGYDEEILRAPATVRARELESLFIDDDIKIIVAAKGGDYEYEILDSLDWDMIENNPKWCQGYSDNTSFLLKYTVEHDVPTVYCGNFGDFGMDDWHRSISENLAFLEGKLTEQRSFDYHETYFHTRITHLEGIYDDERTVWETASGNCRFSGILLGGCMDILYQFIKNDNLDVPGFLNRHDGDIIWYMETFGMDDIHIRRMFDSMEMKGWLDRVSGFVFGRDMFYEGRPYQELISEILSEYDVPLVFGADVGHKAPRMVFVNGLKADFTINDGKCTLKYDI